jgi:hypothetical protein
VQPQLPCFGNLPLIYYDQPNNRSYRNPDLDRITSFSLASLGRSSGIGGGQAALESTVSADNASVGSPVMAGLNQLPVAADGVHGRKRNVIMAGIDSSPGSMEDMDDHDAREEKRRQPVKRACNECRQQKVWYLRDHEILDWC